MHFFAVNNVSTSSILAILEIIRSKIALAKGIVVIITLCVFSEAILGAAMPSKEAARKSRKKENNRAYYEAHTESILSERKDKYSSECRSQHHANEHCKNVTASREKSAEATKTSFNKDLAKSCIESAERQREYYHQDLEK